MRKLRFNKLVRKREQLVNRKKYFFPQEISPVLKD